MKNDEILNLALDHGLRLKDEALILNEMGIDFRVAFACDLHGLKWVLRIPRREDLADQIQHEKNILNLVKKHLSVAVPDWKIASPRLVAYPLLENRPVITFNAQNFEVSWHIDQNENQIVSSLATILSQLHKISVSEATVSGLKVLSTQQARQEILDNIDEVKREIGIRPELESRWRKWVETNTYWPDFSVFVHGDLYAGHILSDRSGKISGLIDWSEAQVSDPAIDFSGHLAVFGEKSLKELISEYEKCGARVWTTMFAHTCERHAASPLKYGVFAMKTGVAEHLDAARNQLADQQS
ncbi:MAG TPA: macrolide 2'-phosphotransferase [Candidatus Rifleibacterium sp.]|jgi:macrolide phosphotransferase|nr:macrolide 2'-phosphotransferase [Candidatus Rifleibacterium sp.]HOI91744.1 macrolide 2'-phosphotransferase [Candidatus Rifleibacterium sp.]HPW59826.1 macrolide 2'-phosphotransferase [Candidatus Rifleibacterium sp.]